MAAPASGGFVQGLLQSLGPWMTGANPSGLDNSFQQYGGTQGLLDAMLQANTPGNLGRAMEGVQNDALQRAAARQGLAQQGLGLQFQVARMPLMLGAMRQRMAQFGLTGQPGTPGAPQGSSPPPASNGAPVASPAPMGAPPALGAPQQTATAGQPANLPPPQQISQGAASGPMGLLNASVEDSILGLPWANNELSAAKTSLQYDPATATQLAAAKNQISQDQQQLYQAYASGNPKAIQGMQTKLATDLGQLHIGSMSGILTRQLPDGSWTTTDPRTGLATNTVTGSTLMPGAAAAQQAMAAAHARGEAAGEVEEVTDKQGNKYYVPRSALLGGAGAAPATSAPAARGSGGGAPGMPAALGPQQEKFLSGQGEEAAKYVVALQNQADAARTANYNFDQMLADAKGTQLGSAAPTREWVMKITSGIGQQFGVAPPKELSSYQELDKYANQVAFAATRQMGSREAAQIVHLQMESNPNKSLTPDAFIDLTHSMQAMNNYVIAKNSAIQAAAKQNGGDAQGAAAQWDAQIDPRAWDVTLSGAMGEKWAPKIGATKLSIAMQYMSPQDRLETLANSPAAMQMQILKLMPVQYRQEMLNASR